MVPDGILEKVNETLTELQLSYLDLYLIHQPVPSRREDGRIVALRGGFGIQDVWRVLETLVLTGKAKSIGVSNFPAVILNDVLNYAKIKPVINQIERTPYLTQPLLIKFCKANGVEITAYGPLGAPGLMSTRKIQVKPLITNELIKQISEKHKKSTAQVLIRWQIQSGVATIPKSIHMERIKENFEVFDFVLSDAEMEAINGLNEGLRCFDQDWHGVPTFT